MSTLCFVLGTRPEIIKLAPLLRRCVDWAIPFQLVHTNQHYDYTMDAIFFEELHLPSPTHNLHAADTSAALFTARVLQGLQALWIDEKPSVVLVQGDTNTVAAAAIAAEKCGIPVAHVEAGLRSDDRAMPEEINRILVDHIAARLYAPTMHQVERLHREGIGAERILLVGNTIADAVSEHLLLAEKAILNVALQQLPERYAVITLHRPALVDNALLLQTVLQQVDAALALLDMQGIFLVHPRTADKVKALGITMHRVVLHDPVGYLPMLKVLKHASLVLTDSGGLQEETALLQIPCVTIRSSTERPETCDAGGNILIPPTHSDIGHTIYKFMQKNIAWKPLYTVPDPSDRILKDILSVFL